jgi:Holliday junction DNA helicase RuvA
MLYGISGKLVVKKENFIVIEAGNIGFKLFMAGNALRKLPSIGENLKVFAFLYLRQDGFELYGFLNEKELFLFEKLNSISGIGPKSAIGILSVAPYEQLIAAINEGKADLLTRASGIGKKTAERIVLELKGKLGAEGQAEIISLMESDIELEEALVGLGYSRQEAKNAISKIDPKFKSLKDRLREALKYAKRK